MPYYIARVRLIEPTTGQEELLLAAMSREGFLRTIALEGHTHTLPPEEYAWFSEEMISAERLNRSLQDIINPLGGNYETLVSRADDIAGRMYHAPFDTILN